jgi:hypothetical protein
MGFGISCALHFHVLYAIATGRSDLLYPQFCTQPQNAQYILS